MRPKNEEIGRVAYKKSEWWETFPKLLMVTEQVSLDNQKLIGSCYCSIPTIPFLNKEQTFKFTKRT